MVSFDFEILRKEILKTELMFSCSKMSMICVTFYTDKFFFLSLFSDIGFSELMFIFLDLNRKLLGLKHDTIPCFPREPIIFKQELTQRRLVCLLTKLTLKKIYNKCNVLRKSLVYFLLLLSFHSYFL